MGLWDAVDSPDAEAQPLEWQRRAHAALVGAGTIERYMRPSPAPGIAVENGGKPGANPLQLRFWEEFDRHIYGGGDATAGKLIFACVAANRAGKTIATFGKFCQHLRDKAKHGEIYWLIAASIDSMKGVPLRTIWNMLPKAMFGNRWHYNPQGNLPTTIILDLPGGRGTVELWPKTENQDIQEFESEAVSGWLWTECRRQAILNAMEPRMSSGGFGIMDYIPCEGWHAIFSEEAKVPKSKVHYVEATVFDNQHNLAPGFVVNEMPVPLGGRGTMSIEEWQTRGLGKPAAFEGIVFKQFDPLLHWRKPFKIPEYLPLFMGADWGYRNPHAFLLAVCMPDEHVIGIGEVYGNECTVFEVCRRLWAMVDSWRKMDCGLWGTLDELLEELAKEQVMGRMFALDDPQAFKEGRFATPVADHIRGQWKRVLPHACVIDASVFDRDQADGTALSDEFERCGFPVARSVKENKVGGVEMIRRRLEQYTFSLFNSCPMHRRDLMTWRYKENKDRIPDPADQFEKKNDHGAASVMYLLRSSPTYNKPVGETKPRTVDEVLTIHDSRMKMLLAGKEIVGSEKF